MKGRPFLARLRASLAGRWSVRAPDDARTHLPIVAWSEGGETARGLACPNCGSMSDKPHLLTVDFKALHLARKTRVVVSCPDCTSRFYAGLAADASPDYGGDEFLTRGRGALYLQHGAGLAQLARPVARLDLPPARRILDIGCGFGFGLDFALRSRLWTGFGIDPAQIAAMGRDRLGLPIEQRMLAADEPAMRGAFDVVMAAETIEHVPDPPAFLHILANTLAVGGVLMLTTPDAEALAPETPAGQLAGLLSPGLHIVFQSAHSLRRLLEAEGFTHIAIERDGGALVATASTRPFVLNTDGAAFTAAYLDYLEQRAADFGPDDDLYWGFAGRALLEAVNAGAFDRATTIRAHLREACQHRFGVDLDAPDLPSETAICTLERLAALVPLNLGTLLYADAMRHLGQGADRPSQHLRFACAAEVSRRLGRAVAALGMADPMSDLIGWAAEAESLLCAAASAKAPDTVPGLLALPPAPGDTDAATGRRAAIRVQAFVGLVNAGRYVEARRLATSCAELNRTPEVLGQDAAFCAAILDLQPGGDLMMAQTRFEWVRRRLGDSGTVSVGSLFWHALRGEAQARAANGDAAGAQHLLRTVVRDCAAKGYEIPPEFAASNQ